MVSGLGLRANRRWKYSSGRLLSGLNTTTGPGPPHIRLLPQGLARRRLGGVQSRGVSVGGGPGVCQTGVCSAQCPAGGGAASGGVLGTGRAVYAGGVAQGR